jgi:class 3 adenylate cyclase
MLGARSVLEESLANSLPGGLSLVHCRPPGASDSQRSSLYLAMEHRLVTIVFIDMQGYTKRSAGQSVEEMKRFHDEFHSFVKDLVEEHDGILVKSLGDGFLVRFDSPTKAVQCSYEM